MLYFVGGPPRVGKSIIARSITEQYGISSVSTDSLGAVLETALGPEAEPGLYAVTLWSEETEEESTTRMVENPTRRLDQQLEESAAVWRAVEPFVSSEQEQGRDVVVEGVAVLPAQVAGLEGIDHRSVFVGNQGSTLKERMRTSARENPDDWMRHAGDGYIEAFAVFVVEMSRYVEEEARRYDFRYVAMEARPFDDAVSHAVESLLGATRRARRRRPPTR